MGAGLVPSTGATGAVMTGGLKGRGYGVPPARAVGGSGGSPPGGPGRFSRPARLQ